MNFRDWLALLVALLVVAAGSRRAAAQDPFELLLIEPLPSGADARIEGQASDLPWRLVKVSGVVKTVAAAHAAATQREARAALWIDGADDALTLRLYDPRKRRLLERRFEVGQDALGRSAALEAMALSVRSALRALAADEEMGEEVGAVAGSGAGSGPGAGTGTGSEPDPDSDTDPDTDPDSDSDTEPDSDTDPDPEPDTGSASLFPALTLAAGWNSAIDGQSSVGQQGPFARLGVVLARVELSVQFQTALPADVSRAGVSLDLTRKLALAGVAFDLHRGSRSRIALGVLGGIAHFHRETRAVAADLQMTTSDNDTLTAAFGLELRAALRLFGDARFSLELELGAGALCTPAAPVLRYELATGRQDRALWLFEPYLQLGPRLRLGL